MDQDMSNEAADPTWAEAQATQHQLEGAQRIFGEVDQYEPIGSAPHLLRVRVGDSWYVVREWSTGTQAAMVELTANALKAGAAVNGVFPEPTPMKGEEASWAVQVGDRLVSAVSWLPGRPLARYGDFRTPDGDAIDVPLPASAPAGDVLLEAVKAMGQLHLATAELVSNPRAGGQSLTRLMKETEATWSQQRRVVGDRAANAPEIRRWLRCGNRVLPVANEHLEQFVTTIGTTSVIHGNVWPVNLLTAGSAADRKLSGIVGWSTVREGSPLIDLAQLAVHTSSWSGALAESVLAAYAETGNLSPVERRMLPVVAALDLIPRVGHLLHLAYVDDRMIGHESQPVLRSGLKQLLVSLENLTGVLAPDTEWSQRKYQDNRRARIQQKPRTAGGTGTKPGRPRGSGRSRQG
jgi:Ser/Thr protein kinase RdoA (MazF antagonist)